MLVSTGTTLINTDDWIYEIKMDGWRILIHKDGDRIEAFTREGNNVTSKFPELSLAAESIKEHTAIIDTEGVVFRNGVSNFEDFAYRGLLTNQDKILDATHTHPVTFVAFDILATNKPLLNEPLTKRKEWLSEVIEPSNYLVEVPSIKGDGSSVYQLTKEKEMEGVVGKRCTSIYKTNQRTKDWLKYKHFKTIETAILGYKENPFTLIVGLAGNYKSIAKVEFGFKQEEKAAFRQIAKQLIVRVEGGVVWLEPLLNCKVQYLDKTSKGLLRTVSFKGFVF
ncbi:DNA ligase [Lysinibacillus sphaericus]|nr:DNA ligase [Lysinibacillus sphaericus]